MKISSLKLHLKYFSKNINLFLIVVLSFILPAFLLLQYMKEMAFITSSALAEGSIISKTHRESNNGALEYSVVYSFKVGETLYRSMSGVGKAKWNKLKDGDPVEVRYSKSNPSENKAWRLTIFMDPLSYEFKYILFPFIVTPFFLLQGLFLLNELKKDFSFVKPLLLHGATIEGKVLESVLHNDKRAPYYIVKYVFKLKEKYEGSFTYPSKNNSKEVPEKDTKGTVAYLDDAPEYNMWIGDSWEKALPVDRRIKTKVKVK